jgi:hypothetical protein
MLRSLFTQTPSGRYVFIACFLVFVACLIAGFSIDTKSMGVNLLAGVGCMALGVPVAIWVVDRYVKHVARERWSRVGNVTYRAIAAHLCDAMAQVFGAFALNDCRPMTPILEGRDEPDHRTIEGLAALASILREVPDPGNNDLSEKAIVYYEENTWDFDQLCDSLLARVVEYSDEREQDLIDALIEFDFVRRAFHTSIVAHKQIVTGGVFVHVAELVDASANVYRALLRHWNPAV